MRYYRALFVWPLVAMMALISSCPVRSAVLRVKTGPPPDVEDGSSWQTAFASVGRAIAAASAGDEIWVAEGVYPERISLRNAVSLYGGFHGTETERRQRDFRRSVTILDGGRAGTVVLAPPDVTRDTVLSGFTIRKGVADGAARTGGGLRCTSSSPVVEDCRFEDNSAVHGGGAANFSGGCPLYVRDTFVGNGLAHSDSGQRSLGGGIYTELAGVEVRNCVFRGNAADDGAGLYEFVGPAYVVGNTLTGNTAGEKGEAVYVYAQSGVVANNIIAFNTGGLYIGNGDGARSRNNDVSRNAGEVNAWWRSRVWTDGNVSLDPLLEADGVSLKADSACIDAGSDADAVPEGTDYLGSPRIRGQRVDIGAVESPYTAKDRTYKVVRVASTGDDANDGSSWSAAKRTVQSAVDSIALAPGGEVWVAAGTYQEALRVFATASLYGGFAGTETRREERDPSRHATVLRASGNATTVTFDPDASAQAVVDGFTISHAEAEGWYANGCGVAVSGGAPVIRGNRIIRNGRGVSVTGGTPLVERCVVADNVGPGVSLSSGASIIRDCLLTRNAEAAIVCLGAGSPLIVNNTVFANASCQGAVRMEGGASPVLVNNLIAFNATGVWGALDPGAAGPAFRSNCVYGNTVGDFRALPDPTGQNGNLRCDPHLADVRRGNWHIQPDSPCRNAGDGTVLQPGETDLDGQPRAADGHVDIGADEGDGTIWPAVSTQVIRVRASGSDANDGLSWARAKRTVQAGIDAAALVGGDVWVAAGTYRESVTLKPGVEAYGGFRGTETHRNQRDWRCAVTEIVPPYNTNAVNVASGERTSVLDGFRLGSARSTANCLGLSLYCSHASPVLRHLTMTGRAYIRASNAVVDDCFIASSSYSGWPALETEDTPALTVTRLTLIGGGASATGGRIEMRNCVVKGANEVGVRLCDVDAVLTNNTIVCNGAGVYIVKGGTIHLANNLVAFNGAGVASSRRTDRTEVTFRNNNVFGNTVGYAGVTDPKGLDGNISADPLLAGKEYGDVRLLAGSPCVDAGDTAVVQDGDTDVAGRPRVWGAAVDIGAVEWDGRPDATGPRVVRVRPDGNDRADGSSWTRAKRTLGAAMAELSSTGVEVWVAEGVYHEMVEPGVFTRLYGGFGKWETARDQRDWVRHRSVVDFERKHSGVVLRYAHSGVDGFTLCNGIATSGRGEAYTVGGNVVLLASASVEHCVITGGVAQMGGGVASVGAISPVIRNNVIAGNRAWYGGAGIACAGAAGWPLICNNTIVNNRAGSKWYPEGGAGVYYASYDRRTRPVRPDPLLWNNIIAFNDVGVGATWVSDGGRIVANDVYGNGVNFLAFPDRTGIDGNISCDPLLAGDGLRLLAGSPCIEAGNNDVYAPGEEDIEGHPRLAGLRVDIGAWEYPATRTRRWGW